MSMNRRSQSHAGWGLAVVMLLATALLTTNALAACSHPHSGIRGKVTIGPVGCGALKEGQDCTEPYAARLRIRRASDRHLVRRVRAGQDGRFKVRLAPGHYVIDPANGHPYPRAHDKRVTVESARYAFVRIGYDSGAR